jgi:predicted ABC-type sugar transport system permease subunit
MHNDITLEKIVQTDHSVAKEKKKISVRRRTLSPLLCSLCAGVGIFGGLSSIFAGLICALIHAALGPETAFEHVSTVLLVIAIPMMLVGSVFLDELGHQK